MGDGMRRDSEELDRLVECLRLDDGYESLAPDSRQAVMARISAPRWSLRPVCVCACVLIMVVAGSVFLVVDRSGSPQSGQVIARQEKPKREPVEKPRTAASEKAVVTALAAVPTEANRPVVRVPRVKPGHIVARRLPRRTSPVRQERPAPAPALEPARIRSVAQSPSVDSQSSNLDPPERPIAAVAVTWPRGDEGTDMSYCYVERDAETGTVTSCFVQREGDSVEIYLETTPGGDEQPPVKGSVDDETTINA